MRLLRLPNVLLLLALLAFVLVYPFLAQSAVGRAGIVVIDWVILILALRALRSTGTQIRWGYTLAVLAIGTHIAAWLSGVAVVYAVSLVAQALFHGLVIVCLLRYVLHDEVMALDELFAAASMYALLAFAFAYVYALIEHLAPGAFYINDVNNPDKLISWWELLYFSFTCLTSVGFGEITPVSDHARSVVMVQQMAGVLYLAILISRLMSMRSGRPRAGE
jgi:Ion channel